MWVGSGPHSCNPPSRGREPFSVSRAVTARVTVAGINILIFWCRSYSGSAIVPPHGEHSERHTSRVRERRFFSLSAVMSELGRHLGRGGPVKNFDTNHMASLTFTVEIGGAGSRHRQTASSVSGLADSRATAQDWLELG